MSRVKLRKQIISNGMESLYLDIYPPIYDRDSGKMKRKHYLNLYIYSKPKNQIQREFNKETMLLAESQQAKRQTEIQNNRFDYVSETKLKSKFIEFFQVEAAKRKNCYNWVMSVNYFKAYFGEGLTFLELNETLCEEYADYLLSGPAIGRARRSISKNTAVAYYNRFKLTLTEAYKKRYLPIDLGSIIENITLQQTHRTFLFLEELERMVHAYCRNPIVKKAGIFSAMTGFRYSDVEKLLWKEIHGSPGNYYIIYNQEKTESAEYYPVSDQVIKFLGAPKDPDSRVFAGLRYDHTVVELKKWLANAGIEKRFTFHGFRHTFATLQIAAGTSIYTVSKLLGHKNIKTTEIYAKIVDSVKREASEKIKINLFNIGENILINNVEQVLKLN